MREATFTRNSRRVALLPRLASPALGPSMSRVGLLVSGEARGFVEGERLSLSASRLAEHVVAPLGNAHHDVHTFLCLDQSPSELHGGNYNATSMTKAIADLLRVQRWASIRPEQAGYRAQSARRLACLRELEGYEKQRRLSFEFILLTRPDAIWYTDLPQLHTFARDAITLKARLLRTAAQNFPLAAASVSFPPDFEVSCRARPASPMEVNVEKARSRCVLAKSSGCVFYDDQFAAIPRHLASTFFVGTAITIYGARALPGDVVGCGSQANTTHAGRDAGGGIARRALTARVDEAPRWTLMQRPVWAAKSAECEKCGFAPTMFEAAFSQTLLDSGCGLAIGTFGFVLLPELGKTLNREPKRRVVQFVSTRVLGNHSPFDELRDAPLVRTSIDGTHLRTGRAPQPMHPIWDC